MSGDVEEVRPLRPGSRDKRLQCGNSFAGGPVEQGSSTRIARRRSRFRAVKHVAMIPRERRAATRTEAHTAEGQ